jgi:hypothetical protein
VCTFPSGPDYPRIASDGAGGAFVVWRDFRNDSDGDLYIQRIATGFTIAPSWPIDGIPVTSAPRAQGVAGGLAPDGAGGVIVVWQDHRDVFTTRRDIYAQRVMADGTIATGWPADGLPVCTHAADQVDPRIASDGAGGAIIVWEDYRAGGAYGDGDIASGDIYALRVRPDGTTASGWTASGNPVCAEAGGQRFPVPVEDGEGGAIVAWGDLRNFVTTGGDVYANRVTGTGGIAPGWPAAGVSLVVAPEAQGASLQLVSDGTGGAIAAWTDYRYEPPPDPIGGDIFAQRVTAAGTIASGWPVDGLPVAVATSYQLYTDMVADGVGGAYLVWEDYRDYENTNADLFGQRITGSGGIAQGWPANGLRVATGPGWQLTPSLVLDGQGGVLFAFERTFGAADDLFAQRVNADGMFPAGWPAEGVPLCVGPRNDTGGVAVTDGAGGMIVALNHGSSIYAVWVKGDGPTAALVALESADAEPDRVSLTWYGAEAAGLLGTVERRTTVSGWERLGQVIADGRGRFRYEDDRPVAGTRYAYRLTYRTGGEDVTTAETWVDVPAPEFSLYGARPNPVVGEFVVGFSLPSTEPARLEVYDVAGRQVLVRDVGSLGIGRHQVNLAPGRRLPAGVFTLVLTQAELRAVARIVVIR